MHIGEFRAVMMSGDDSVGLFARQDERFSKFLYRLVDQIGERHDDDDPIQPAFDRDAQKVGNNGEGLSRTDGRIAENNSFHRSVVRALNEEFLP